MSDQQQELIGEVLGDFVPITEDHPVAQETFDAVKAALEARAAGETPDIGVVPYTGELQELQYSGLEVGIIKPGDTVILSTRDRHPHEHLKEFKRRMELELPGVKVVIMDGMRVEAIYREG
jgi:hypothetical protein